MRGEHLNDLPYYNFGDPYYTESAYGAGNNYNNDHHYYGPNWSCPGGGYGPGMGCGGMGPGWGPGMGYDNWDDGNYGNYGNYWPGCGGGSVAPNEWAELMQLIRDTNQCCRRMLEMMQEMHHGNNQGCMDAE